MADSLIKTILSEANNPNPKIENLPNLNTLLKAESTGSLIQLYSLIGGMGSEYQSIEPFLTVGNKKEITAIDSEKIFALAQSLKRSRGNDYKKAAYRAGICFALVAVYGVDAQSKLDSYKELVSIFEKEGGSLHDAVLLKQCKEFLEPIHIGVFNPTHKIIWSWELKGKDNALDFETKRQAQILGTPAEFSLQKSLFLLGLPVNGEVDGAKISEAAQACYSKLKNLAGLERQGVAENPLFNNLKKAETLLAQYAQFKEFNYKQAFDPLLEQIIAVKKARFSEGSIFNDVQSLFKALDIKMKDIAKSFQIENEFQLQPEHPYITSRMIEEKLGSWKSLAKKYEAQLELEKQAAIYWDLIDKKIAPLIATASSYATSSDSLFNIIDSINQLLPQIDTALHILSEIKGSALEESSVLSDAANNIDLGNTHAIDFNERQLKLFKEELNKKITQHVEATDVAVEQLVELTRTSAKDTETLPEKDLAHFITEKQLLVDEINEELSWLRNLDPYTKSLAEKKFKMYIVSQVTIEEVINAVCGELSKVNDMELPKLQVALKNLVGREYNQNLPLQVTIQRYFNSRRNKDLRTEASSFINSIKEIISSQFGVQVQIAAKNLIPEPTYMTLQMAIKNLEDNKHRYVESIKTVSDKLNTDLQKPIESLLLQYEQTLSEIEQIVQEKNSLSFSWQMKLDKFFQKQKNLSDEFAKLNKMIPEDFDKAEYILPEIKALIKKMKRHNATFEQKAASMLGQVGKAGLDALKYLLLKNWIRQEKAAYRALGKHDQARIDSLEQLSSDMEAIETTNLDNRFSSLIRKTTAQLQATALSHQKIGFLGHYRPSRLQKMYTKIIEVASELDEFFPKESWKNINLSLDTLKYLMLKNNIQQQCKTYIIQGSHHQDRSDSLARLNLKITELDAAGTDKNRFATLFATLQTEEKTTIASHMRVGFWGTHKPCRLQVVYGKIIADATLMKTISFDDAPVSAFEESFTPVQ